MVSPISGVIRRNGKSLFVDSKVQTPVYPNLNIEYTEYREFFFDML